jgi:uncharacterized membrane protein
MTHENGFKIIGIFLLIVLLAVPYASADWSSVAVKNQITGKVIYPGDTIEFPITIESGYNDSEDAWCNLVVKSKPDGWSVGFFEGNDQITHLLFPEDNNEPEDIVLRVKTPTNAPSGVYSIWAEFRPDDGDIISREFTVTVDKDAEPNLDIYSRTPGMETRSTETVEYLVTLENKYKHRVTASLDTVGKPDGWNVEFLQEIDDDDYRLTKLSVAAKSKEDFIVKVRPVVNATDGDYHFRVRAVPESGDRGVSLDLLLKINNGLEKEEMLTIYQSTDSIVLNPGSSKEIYVTLRNSGDRTLNNVDLKVQGITGITAEVRSFGTVDKLEPGQSWDTSIEITARADASPGTKDLLMRAVSNEAQSQDGIVEVVVEKSGSSGFIGIGMVIFAIVLLIFIVSKFGRR